MDQFQESKLKFHSLGIVAKDKPRNTDTIDVFLVEQFPHTNGPVNESKNKLNANTSNLKGVKTMSQVEGKATSKATWFPFGHSNRMSSPDVIENETVAVFKYADTGLFYWTTMFREPKIRRLETVMYAFGNLQAKLVPFDKNSSYWFQVSTHDKHIHLHTADSDGEPYKYDIYLDTAYGSLEIKDDVGNYIKLDSPRNNVHVETNESITAKTKHIQFECTDMVVKASQSVTFDTPVVFNTGEERTTGPSYANPHYRSVH